jgi:hypothetical protein
MSIKIKGLDQLTKDLRKFGQDGKRVVIDELDISATTIQRRAFERAPAFLDSGQTVPLNIKQRIDKRFENGGLTAKIGVQGSEPMDGWVEFRTGAFFQDLIASEPRYQTPEILALARQFFRTGDGTLKGKPYLFPSFFEESPRLIENLKKELETLAKKV